MKLYPSECSIDLDLSLIGVGAADCTTLKLRVLKADAGTLSMVLFLPLVLNLNKGSISTYSDFSFAPLILGNVLLLRLARWNTLP